MKLLLGNTVALGLLFLLGVPGPACGAQPSARAAQTTPTAGAAGSARCAPQKFDPNPYLPGEIMPNGLARFQHVLDFVRRECGALPNEIVFEATDVRKTTDTAAPPKTWRHVIGDPAEIQSIMDALASATALDVAVSGPHPAVKYRYLLTLRFREPCGIDSLTLDLTREGSVFYCWDALVTALSKYPPGFKPQIHAVRQ